MWIRTKPLADDNGDVNWEGKREEVVVIHSVSRVMVECGEEKKKVKRKKKRKEEKHNCEEGRRLGKRWRAVAGFFFSAQP